MEGNLSSRSMMPGNVSFSGFDLQEPIRLHHHQQQQQHLLAANHHHHHHHPRQGSSPMVSTLPKNFPLMMGSSSQAQDHHPCVSLSEFNKVRPTSDEDEPDENGDGGGNDSRKGKKDCSQWHRVKWSDDMVRLLITAVSYINEEASADNNSSCSRRKHANLQKKGKWKSVSKVLAERRFFVSPQQCEDKFNDLNKRYKRLNEILGRGTSCEVVENPSLLDVLDHVPEKAKDEVRKILSSRHLHYEEMCSYHNGNRLYLPPDLELQRSLLALGARDDHEEHDSRSYHPHEDNDHEFDHEAEYEDHEDSGDGLMQNPSKRARLFQGLDTLDCNKSCDDEANQDMEANSVLKKQWMSRSIQLEEQRLQIETQMLELEKERFKWQRFCRKKDRELDAARIEIEQMKLENERMALELRRKEMEFNAS